MMVSIAWVCDSAGVLVAKVSSESTCSMDVEDGGDGYVDVQEI